ncbi:MAG: cobalamin B12-binding domain-containing protein [Pseudomonadota bacterium]
MHNSSIKKGSGLVEAQRPAIRFLVESALKAVMFSATTVEPRSREEWVTRLTEALMSEADSSYEMVIASLIANGTSTEEIFQLYVPAAAKLLGELWVNDQASFVDVTIGAARLQTLFRDHEANTAIRWSDRSIPLGQSVLMVIPEYEHHALGAFVTADNLRRHGVWVHMAVGLSERELAKLIRSDRFAMIGISLATKQTLNKTRGLVEFLRRTADSMPPIVIGGRIVEEDRQSVLDTGVDFAVTSAEQAIQECDLASISKALPFPGMG